MAAKRTFAEEAIKTSKTPGPIYYIPWSFVAATNYNIY